MTLPKITLSDEDLHQHLKQLKGTENRTNAEIVLHLSEVDSRGTYRDAGYSSLFTYCRGHLGYSEGSSFRRVRAARCLEGSPEIYHLLAEGKLSLSALSELSPVLNDENRDKVLSLAQGASKRDAGQIAASFGAVQVPKRDTIRVKKVVVRQPAIDLFSRTNSTSSTSPERPDMTQKTERLVEKRYTFSFEATKEFAMLYEQAKAVIGPCKIAEVMERALREYVTKRTRKLKPRTAAITSVAKPSKARIGFGRVPQSVRREVFERDGGRCTYVSKEGMRCSERQCLHVDHVDPSARGGSNDIENLRLLCGAHNQLAAEQCFGREFMKAKREERVSHVTT